MSDAPPLSNGGPPLDNDARPWGPNGIGNYFEWAVAKKRAFDAPYDIVMMPICRADKLGLTYEEYTLEILERGLTSAPPIPSALPRSAPSAPSVIDSDHNSVHPATNTHRRD